MCVGGPPPNCDDGNLRCTDDLCDPLLRLATSTRRRAATPRRYDGVMSVTPARRVTPAWTGTCVRHRMGFDCDDDDVCTTDICDSVRRRLHLRSNVNRFNNMRRRRRVHERATAAKRVSARRAVNPVNVLRRQRRLHRRRLRFAARAACSIRTNASPCDDGNGCTCTGADTSARRARVCPAAGPDCNDDGNRLHRRFSCVEPVRLRRTSNNPAEPVR